MARHDSNTLNELARLRADIKALLLQVGRSVQRFLDTMAYVAPATWNGVRHELLATIGRVEALAEHYFVRAKACNQVRRNPTKVKVRALIAHWREQLLQSHSPAKPVLWTR